MTKMLYSPIIDRRRSVFGEWLSVVVSSSTYSSEFSVLRPVALQLPTTTFLPMALLAIWLRIEASRGQKRSRSLIGGQGFDEWVNAVWIQTSE